MQLLFKLKKKSEDKNKVLKIYIFMKKIHFIVHYRDQELGLKGKIESYKFHEFFMTQFHPQTLCHPYDGIWNTLFIVYSCHSIYTMAFKTFCKK